MRAIGILLGLAAGCVALFIRWPVAVLCAFLLYEEPSSWKWVGLAIVLSEWSRQVVIHAFTLQLLTRIKHYVADVFPDTQFREENVDAYLDDLQILRVPGEGIITNTDIVLPATVGHVPDFGRHPPAFVRIFVHETEAGSRRPTPYFCYDAPAITGFVFTSVPPAELSSLRRFFVYHEIGHCISANRSRRRYAIRAFGGSLCFVLLGLSYLNVTSLLIAGAYCFTGVVLWRQPQRTREHIADLFAVRNINPQEAKEIREVVESRPKLFYDPVVGDHVENERRLEWLRKLLEVKVREQSAFDKWSDWFAWDIASPYPMWIALIVPVWWIVFAQHSFSKAVPWTNLTPYIWSFVVLFVCMQVVVVRAGCRALDLHRRLGCIQRLPLDVWNLPSVLEQTESNPT